MKNNQDESVKVDEIANLLARVKPVEVYAHEEALATILIQKALENAQVTSTAPGISLAAAFDLIVAAEYYGKLTNKRWLYCPIDNSPLLIYPYTNTCPRCILQGDFLFHQANKPPSGTIGKTTSRLLCVFLKHLFKINSQDLEIYHGIEPIDVIIYDSKENIVLLSEVKAAPLTTLPLAVPVEIQTELGNEGELLSRSHSPTDNSFISASNLHILLPKLENDTYKYELINLGIKGSNKSSVWVYEQMGAAFNDDNQLFHRYFQFWSIAFSAYNKAARGRGNFPEPVYWLTNACGQPIPRPENWPQRRSGEGYESISDSKSSVGMDRTDDIKKGIYQVLKIAASQKPKPSTISVKTAILSNIHAVRHYNDYLLELQDIVWTIDETGQAKTVADLPAEKEVFNLFDGIITFTESHIRDEWIKQKFRF
ncbi:hypothetical protein [Sphaerospermopsis sp. LEGE 08334]|jgi:hypothetical protein|uniref:hypothetical protein n=1 Tax=Sphaerospermopsis sp. LEGE 08334 TaxID=1828651 RepID=UPI001880308E|nr:hypothetical protein [Sphaerospermopsis sp. LEGE 08334]MBE9055178.1 hypothetical protein [Sphaerospermopsis sp. LEGE 08334]